MPTVTLEFDKRYDMEELAAWKVYLDEIKSITFVAGACILCKGDRFAGTEKEANKAVRKIRRIHIFQVLCFYVLSPPNHVTKKCIYHYALVDYIHHGLAQPFAFSPVLLLRGCENPVSSLPSPSVAEFPTSLSPA